MGEKIDSRSTHTEKITGNNQNTTKKKRNNTTKNNKKTRNEYEK